MAFAFYGGPLLAFLLGVATAFVWLKKSRTIGLILGTALLIVSAAPLSIFLHFFTRPYDEPGQSNEVFDANEPRVVVESRVVTAASFDGTLQAAEQGDVESQERVAEDFEQGEHGAPRSAELAAKWYLKAASQGDVRSAFNLSSLYQRGEGVKQDKAQALQWLTKSAEGGHVPAQAELGYKYGTGQGVPQSYDLAMKWCEVAAKNGEERSQFYLGRMYELGKGTKPDDAQALRWYLHAWMAGAKKAEAGIEREQRKLTNDVVAKAYRMVADELGSQAKK